jgi:hypothetical protein
MGSLPMLRPALAGVQAQRVDKMPILTFFCGYVRREEDWKLLAARLGKDLPVRRQRKVTLALPARITSDQRPC